MEKIYFFFGKCKCMALIMFMTLAISQLSLAQSTANYAFTTNATGSLALDANGNTVDMSSGTTQLVAADLDDNSSAVNNVGFNFYMYGNIFTQFSANSNGVIQLGSSQVGNTTYVLSGGTTTTPRIGALAADLRTGLNGKVHYKIVGTAPNRCLVVEFNNMSLTYVGTPGSNDGTYQVRLYESSGIIEYVYGAMFRNASTTTAAAIYSGFSVGSVLNTTASITTSTNTVSNGATFNVNSYTASTNIANLHSTTDGSRRIYKFTPPVPAAGPTSLVFSGVTTTGTTLNWTAASPTTNIVKYVVLNSINGGATYNFVANVPLGTDTYIATALTPGTTFDWKVIAVSEGAESTSLIGTQATLAGATYYWVGTTGSNWNTPANWNTAADNTGSTRTVVATTDALIVDGDGTTPGGATTINVDLISFTIGQLVINSNTNLTLQSNNTTTRTITVSGGTGDDFVIEAGSVLNLSHAANAVAIAFSGTANTGTIAGTLNIGGGSGNTFNSTGGTSTLVTVGTTGIINNSFAGGTGVTGTVATLSFLDGSALNVSGQTTGAPNVPLATWGTNATLTISGLTTSTTAPTNNNQSFGNIVYNCPASTASFNFFGSTTTSVIKGNLTIQATGTGQFRTVSSGTLTINGNVNVLAGRYAPFSGAGTILVSGNTTIASGSIFDISQAAGFYVERGTTFTNNGTINGPNSTTASNLYFFPVSPIAQIWDGTGTIGAALNSVSINNTAGLTITQTGPITILRANLFSGNITGSNNLTIGTGLALACVVQVGATGLTGPGGSFMSAPTWNLGTGTYALLYSQCDAYTATNEIPPSRTVTNVTLNNTNGVTLSGGPLEVSGTLTLTAGNFTTSTANLLTLGTASAAGTLTGGSATSYIRGPFARTIATANANTNYISFPVGKTAYAPVSLAPATTAISVMKAEAFDTNSGTTDASIISLAANRRWETPLVSGTITNINVRLGDASLVNGNIPVQANAAAGVYSSSFGSTATFTAGTPNTVQSNASVTSGSYTGFLSYAISNTCSGAPTPGLTTATSSVICLGGSTTLGITTIPAGSGITYQWQNSPDGITYSDIIGATASTYLATPTQATFYQCVVTCSVGPISGTSTPIQITFTNNVTGTTPGTRCGPGTVTLGATPNPGAVINWYTSSTGGAPLATGISFVTPSISVDTPYYVAAETSIPGVLQFGTGITTAGTTNLSAFNNYRASAKYQMIYTASELNALGIRAGNINSIAYNVSSLGSAATNTNYTVKMATTALLTFPNTTFPTPTFTTCYGPSTYTHTASGWQTILFVTPFNWDGTSNVIIEVSHDGIDSSASADTQYTATVGNTVLYSYNGGSNTLSTNRFNVLFNGQIACSSPRVVVNATVTAPPVFTLNTATSAICVGESSSAVTITAGAVDYDTYVWSPLTGVSGDAISGWIFNPAVSTSYTLTASQSGGALCTTTASVNVTVNPKPSVIVITPTSASTCVNSIQTLVATGGTLTPSGSTPIGTDITVTTQNGTEPTAFNNRYKHYWMQMVFTAAELNAAGIQAGNINGVKFNITTIGSATSVSDFRVYMGNTALNTLTGFVSSGLSQVFAAPTYTQAIGVNSIVFNTPYVWDGISNVIVDIRSTGADSSNNSSTYYTATPDNKTVSAVTSTTFASSNAYVASNPPGTLSLKRLNTTFDWTSTVPTTLTWSPVTDLYTDALATVAYIAGTNASTVYVKSATAATTTYTATANVTATGCQTTATVDVVVNPNTSNNTVISACDTYTWAVNGTTYTVGGTYTNIVGCHTETLDLTINVTPTADDPSDVSVCDSYILPALTVGNYFTGAGGTGTALSAGNNITSTQTIYVYAETGTTPNCTDENSFTVTITTSSSLPTETVTACDNYTWSANGTNYTVGGIYTSTTNCVTRTLDLTITTSSQLPTETVTACDNYTWSANGTNYTVGGTYTSTTNCVTRTLDLTITTSSQLPTETVTACDNYTWSANGTNYTVGGIYTSTTNCVTRTLDLTITTSSSLPTEVVSVCNTSYTWSANGTNYTVGGIYTSTTACVTRTLDLTVLTATTPTGAATQTLNGGIAADVTIEDIVVSGTGIVWYPTALDAANDTNAITAGTVLTDNTYYYAVSVNGTCRSTALEVLVTVVLGNASFDLSQLNYYPNPVKDIFNVKYNKEIISVDVYDLTGRKVIEMKPNTLDVQLNMTNLSSAMYIVRLQSVDGITELKVYKN